MGAHVTLPASVQEIADVIGRDAALYLIGQLPTCVAGKDGKRSTRVILYVPHRLTPNHRLVQILGWERASALVKGFGGEILQPANCNAIYKRFRDTEIKRMLRGGASNGHLASVFGMSREAIRLLRMQIPQEALTGANDNTAQD
jgi:hypothetical protein